MTFWVWMAVCPTNPATSPDPVHLHQLSLGQHADGLIQPRQQPGHGGFPGARVAQKHQVQADGRHRQLLLLAQLADLHQVDETAHVLFHVVQSAQFIQASASSSSTVGFGFCSSSAGTSALTGALTGAPAAVSAQYGPQLSFTAGHIGLLLRRNGPVHRGEQPHQQPTQLCKLIAPSAAGPRSWPVSSRKKPGGWKTGAAAALEATSKYNAWGGRLLPE